MALNTQTRRYKYDIQLGLDNLCVIDEETNSDRKLKG